MGNRNRAIHQAFAAGYRVFAAETNPFGVAVMAAMKT